MDKKRKWYIALSIALTALFVLLGVTVFQKSFMRLWETLGGFVSSCKFYFCETFRIKHTTSVSIIEKSKVLEWNYVLPESYEAFFKRTGLFIRLFVNAVNFRGFSHLLGLLPVCQISPFLFRPLRGHLFV